MQKKMVVIDTNVLVSAAIGFGYASKIVKLFTEDAVYDISYSAHVLHEYVKVASYERIGKKYPLFKQNMETAISELKDAGFKFLIQLNFELLKDSSDNKFLDLAYACQADYLITGNHLDFTITEFYQTKIVNPKIFWELYEKDQL